jgi:hypothetical protein
MMLTVFRSCNSTTCIIYYLTGTKTYQDVGSDVDVESGRDEETQDTYGNGEADKENQGEEDTGVDSNRNRTPRSSTSKKRSTAMTPPRSARKASPSASSASATRKRSNLIETLSELEQPEASDSE